LVQDVHHSGAITKELLRKRTDEYHRWVEAFARKRHIPMEWSEKGVRKEDYVHPYLQRMERQNFFGVYFILKSMEMGPSFRSALPHFPVQDPDYRIIARQRCRYTHDYFYIRDEVLGPLSLCVGSFLPFQITYYLNGHHYIERELLRRNIAFRKDDNAFLAVADPKVLQAAAERFRADIIRKRLDYWTWFVGPNSPKPTARRSTYLVTTRFSRLNILEIWSSGETSPSINSLSVPVISGCCA
jgi:hypothetical protein